MADSLQDLLDSRADIDRAILESQVEPTAAAVALFARTSLDDLIAEATEIQAEMVPGSPAHSAALGNFLQVLPAVRTILDAEKQRLTDLLAPQPAPPQLPTP